MPTVPFTFITIGLAVAVEETIANLYHQHQQPKLIPLRAPLSLSSVPPFSTATTLFFFIMCTTTALTTDSSSSAVVRPISSSKRNSKRLVRQSTSLSEAGLHATSGSLVSFAVVLFSIYFPFLLAPWAASETYHPAFYTYARAISHFDNTAWTYGTDYLLAFVMMVLILNINCSRSLSKTHAWRSRGLLGCYALSVTAGGLAHQFYTELEQRNTWHFRALWTVCVGSVTAASAFMGPIGTELVSHEDELLSILPVIPEFFWLAFAVCATLVVVAGGMSFQRPACDIFIAGITQFPSTFYMMSIFALGLPTHPIPKWTRVVGVLGFILNAPLLPLYPLLVQYTNWSLASVNTLLHTWLMVAWGLQGLALRRIEQSLVAYSTPPPAAVPMKRKEQ